MRKVQISMKMELFDDQAIDAKHEQISVYADANDVYEAICAAQYELMYALRQQGYKLPACGTRQHHVGDTWSRRDGND